LHHSKWIEEYAADTGVALLFVATSSRWINSIDDVVSRVKRYFHAHGSMDESFASGSLFFQMSFSSFTSPELLCSPSALGREGAKGPASVRGRGRHGQVDENVLEKSLKPIYIEKARFGPTVHPVYQHLNKQDVYGV